MIDREYYNDERKFKQNQLEKQSKLDNAARQNLKRKIKISVDTTGVGALSDFEEAFGRLWAHGKRYHELSEEEKDFRKLWMKVRTSILDRANNSKKILLREVDRCEFKDYKQNRYVTVFKTKGEENGQR